MPVRKDAFDKIKDYAFDKQSYKNLYTALRTTSLTCNFATEPSFANYYNKVYALYGELRNLQKQLKRFSPEAVAENAWNLISEVS